MSDQDRELLIRLRPELMNRVTIEGSDLLAQLRIKGALTDLQHEVIKVIKQYHIFNFWAPFLFKANKGRFLILEA